MGPGVIVVDLATNAVVDSIPVHLGVDYDGAQSGAFSADGSILTVGTRVGFEVIDLASKKSLGGTTVGFVGKLIHHPSRPVLYAPSQTGMFELDEKSGAIIRRFPGGGYDGAVVSPDGATLYAVAFGGEGAAVWDLATGALTRTLGGIEGTDMAISPDGRFLYVIRGGFDFDNRLRIYDAASGTMVRNVSLGGLTRRLALAADGTAIITNENSTGEPGWVDFVR
jgi:DNA-binding beta-propeller fold protein YncE